MAEAILNSRITIAKSKVAQDPVLSALTIFTNDGKEINLTQLLENIQDGGEYSKYLRLDLERGME
ncbi:TPA: hypothetical protein ACGO1T_001904 [Streptococcus suis]